MVFAVLRVFWLRIHVNIMFPLSSPIHAQTLPAMSDGVVYEQVSPSRGAVRKQKTPCSSTLLIYFNISEASNTSQLHSIISRPRKSYRVLTTVLRLIQNYLFFLSKQTSIICIIFMKLRVAQETVQNYPLCWEPMSIFHICTTSILQFQYKIKL